MIFWYYKQDALKYQDKLPNMENISMKSTIKFALVIALFCSTAFAEGEMGTGGRSCPQNAQTCFAGNPTDMPTDSDKNQKDLEDSFLVFVKDFLTKIFG